jgi:hypothetical protein
MGMLPTALPMSKSKAVTTLRSGRVIDNKVGKEGKGKDVSLQNPNLTPQTIQLKRK